MKFKKTGAWIALGAVFLLGLGGSVLTRRNAAVLTEGRALSERRTIVVDAGHGGPDGGAVGSADGTVEDGINLAISQKLRAALETAGYRVVMTRETDAQIAEGKNADMRERRRIIEESGQSATVSIHQNFYGADGAVSGPQVFYAPGSAEGAALAQAIQQELNRELLPESPRVPMEGDYYIVKSGEAPAVIVECGFLSNAREERLLGRSQYQVRIALAIGRGLTEYFEGQNGNGATDNS